MIEVIWNHISPYFLEIVAMILSTIVTYISIKVKNLYQKRLTMETKKEVAKSVVEMVEQIANKYNWSSAEKYDKAKTTIIELLANEGIKITDIELEVLIESFCKSLKEKKKQT